MHLWTGNGESNLPAYVVLTDPGGLPVDNVRNWTAGWLPAAYQGTMFRSGKSPVPNLSTPAGHSRRARRKRNCGWSNSSIAHISSNIRAIRSWRRGSANFEIAARMQAAVPDALDLSQETAATKKLYGLDNPVTAEYGTRCLIARRLVERGVRFVQLFLSGPAVGHALQQRRNAEGSVRARPISRARRWCRT